MILIIGAGLAGLSTAYHLGNEDYQIYEKEGEVGGLCRSYEKDGFTFDYTGHLLHLRNDYTATLLEKLLPHTLTPHKRRASIYSKGVLTPYPFQANLYKLPKDVIKECLIGFIEAKEMRKGARTRSGRPHSRSGYSFKDWILTTFGTGIAEHFMVPYNEKLWRRDVDELSSEWVDWSIPLPTLDEVIGGALGLENEHMGYSAQFLYPEAGGIGLLPQSFLPHVNTVHCHRGLTAIDLKEKRAWFDDNRSVNYDFLVSTVPLPELIDMIRDVPSRIVEMRQGLKHISVLDVNMGIASDFLSDQHWIYFPEPEVPFYRAGFYSHFSFSAAPHKAASLYVEVSYLPDTPLHKNDIQRSVYDGLHASGIVQGNDQVIVEDVIDIPYAYVIYDPFRQKNLPKIIDYLESNDVFSIGRYGSWEYMSMEDTLLQGKKVAEALHG
jgi:protoporphyrinogen oxidase